MNTNIYFRGSRQEARQLAYDTAAMLTGARADSHDLARGVFYAVGFSVLTDIKTDFITKSRGGTGRDGVKWRKLSKPYLAYGRRFGRGEQTSLKSAAGLGKGNRFAPGGNEGLLTAEQLKRWKSIFAAWVARLSLSTNDHSAAIKARAAAIAWIVLKREGAKTKLEVYGNREVEINRDTGVLLNSLSPGELANSAPFVSYARPSGDGGAQQVFQSLSNGIIVGTNVPYAAGVQKIRPFLPTGEMPQEWRENVKKTATLALSEAVAYAYQMGA